jgi:protein-tyrosine phosphatase
VNVPLDVAGDREFWTVWGSGPEFATSLYYRPHRERFPGRIAAVLRAIARTRPGGVVFHCQGGRDRAGQVAMLVLALAGGVRS